MEEGSDNDARRANRFPHPRRRCRTEEPSAAHRRRGAELEDAIKDAAFAELSRGRVRSVTIESVAARAQTGKA